MAEPMRVLIVCDYSLGYLGGAQIALMRQAQALAAAGHRVSLLAPDAGSAGLDAAVEAVEPPPSRTLPVLELPLLRASPELAGFAGDVLDDHRIDAVLLHSEFGLAATVSAEARRRRIPVLHTVHTFFWTGPWAAAPFAPAVRAFHRAVTGLPSPRMKLAPRPLDSALRQMTLAVARTADVVVSPSAHQAERLREAGLPRVEAVSNVTEPVAEPAPMPPFDRLRVAWLGRFAPEKRLDAALGGVASASPALPLSLRIAGGTPNARQQRLGGGRAEWLGRLAQAGAAELVDSSHALLLTSNGFDNQPMVVLEAFSRGRPVILVDRVLAKEFGDAAVLCDSPDPDGIARTLERIAADPRILERATAAAVELSHRASGAAHATRIAGLVEEVRKG